MLCALDHRAHVDVAVALLQPNARRVAGARQPSHFLDMLLRQIIDPTLHGVHRWNPLCRSMSQERKLESARLKFC